MLEAMARRSPGGLAVTSQPGGGVGIDQPRRPRGRPGRPQQASHREVLKHEAVPLFVFGSPDRARHGEGRLRRSDATTCKRVQKMLEMGRTAEDIVSTSAGTITEEDVDACKAAKGKDAPATNGTPGAEQKKPSGLTIQRNEQAGARPRAGARFAFGAVRGRTCDACGRRAVDGAGARVRARRPARAARCRSARSWSATAGELAAAGNAPIAASRSDRACRDPGAARGRAARAATTGCRARVLYVTLEPCVDVHRRDAARARRRGSSSGADDPKAGRGRRRSIDRRRRAALQPSLRRASAACAPRRARRCCRSSSAPPRRCGVAARSAAGAVC